MRAFDNAELSVQMMKKSFFFFCNLWSWTRVFVDVDSSSLISFID